MKVSLAIFFLQCWGWFHQLLLEEQEDICWVIIYQTRKNLTANSPTLDFKNYEKKLTCFWSSKMIYLATMFLNWIPLSKHQFSLSLIWKKSSMKFIWKSRRNIMTSISIKSIKNMTEVSVKLRMFLKVTLRQNICQVFSLKVAKI